MLRRRYGAKLILAALVLTMIAAACGGGDDDGESAAPGECTPAETQDINFAAYSTPREVYGKIISGVPVEWKEEHDDQSLIFQESYGGSTTQAENVVNGFEADIVALSLAPDVDQSPTRA